MPTKIFLVLALIFCSQFTSAQKLCDFKGYDTMTYVYKLDKAQTDYLVKKRMIEDTSMLFKNLWKMYPRSSFKKDTLPNGNFIIANIDREIITYTYEYRTSVDVRSKVIDNTVILFLIDKKTGANVETARMEIDGKRIEFNTGYGGYSFKKDVVSKTNLSNGKVCVSFMLGDDYNCLQYYFNEGNRTPAQKYNTPFYGGPSEGYLITDKPLYKPLDTLNLKAFLTNPYNGRPIRNRATLTITEPMQNFVFSKRLKKASPGAFVYKWPIPDTLKIDRTFQINLQYKKHQFPFTKSSSFYLEDYVLNANKYDVSLRSELFFAGEDIAFYVSALDANQFPMQGTQIHYKLSIANVQDFFMDTMLLSNLKKNNWYEKDTVYSYENFMELKIPSEILPKINAQYNLEISFTDPNTFERKVMTKSFSKLLEKEKVLIYQNEDSIHIHCLYNLRDTNRTYQMISLSNNDTLFNKTITTPYSAKLSPYNTKIIFIDKDSVVTPIDIIFNKFTMTHLEGKRHADSMKISFSFPFDEAVYYNILKGNKIVQSGKSKQLNFTVADNSKDAYTILFTNNLNHSIENNFYKVTYVPQLHKIKITSDIPAQAFPGQKIPITIKTTDYKNRPLKKINIAAYAVNKQFEGRLNAPEIMVPEMYKDLTVIKQPEVFDYVPLSPFAMVNRYHITNEHLAKYNLRKNEFYELRYPKKEMANLSKDIQSKTPEFSVAITHKDVVYAPKYILLDGSPVYISDLKSDVYSFQSTPGEHEITVRYFDKKIVFNHVQFEAHKKYWIGINIDSLSKKSKFITVTDSLPVVQPNDSEKELLYGSLLLLNQTLADTFYVRSKKDSTNLYKYSPYHLPQLLNIDGDAFRVIGPLHTGENAIITIGKKQHTLLISSEYAHYYDGLTKEFTSKNIGPVKGMIFGFKEEPIYDDKLAALVVPDTVKPLPEPVKLNYNEAAYQANKKPTEREYNQNYRYPQQSNQFGFILKNNDKKIFVKALWILDRSKPDNCDFVPNITRMPAYKYYKYGQEGNYDIYLLLNENRVCILKNIALKNMDEFYINPALLPNEELTNERLSLPLKIYSDLTKLPLLPFYFPPEESLSKLKETQNTKRHNPYLHGLITDKSLSAIQGTIVLLEVNGVFKYGATTNNNGEFEILNIPEGSYQIKVYNPSYQILNFAPSFLKQGNEYELNVSMNSSATQMPVYESVQQDFRFAVFLDKKKKDIFKIQLYDKETRDALQAVSMTLYENEKVVDAKDFKGTNDIEIPFPNSETVLYTLEMKREGYTPLLLHNIRFIKNTYYTLVMFMSPIDERIQIKKKEYDLRMGDVVIRADIAQGEVYEVEGSEAKYVEAQQMNAYRGNNYTSNSAGAYNAAPPYPNLRAESVQISASSPQSLSYAVDGMVSTTTLGVTTFSPNVGARENIYVSDNMIEQVANNNDISVSRKKFSDVGFWEPNHITNKKGITTFDIRLPDNITTWKTNILAMGKRRMHGIDSMETKVYKPLQTISIIPQFLYMNDKVFLKAKFTNLTSEPKPITVNILVNDKSLLSKQVSVKNDYVDSVKIEAASTNTLKFRAGLQYKENYKDEEVRDIPVFSPALKLFYNQHFMMEKDSTYSLHFANETKGSIILTNKLYEKIIEEINQLNQYEYNCVEQLTSKLRGLLIKERINKTMGLKENLTPSIYQLINRLANYQNADGTWGWWKRESVNWRMTMYAYEVLQSANSAGYNNSNYYTAHSAIQANLSSFNISDKMYAYYLFQKTGATYNGLKEDFEKIKFEDLNATDKMYYYKMKEMLGEAVSTLDMYALYLQLNNQSAKPYVDNFFYDPRATVFTAYQLFSKTSIGDEWLKMFKTQLTNGQLEQNLNTYSKACMIEALSSSVTNTDGKPITSEIIINDTLKVKTFPYRLPITSSSYKLQHTGGNVFVNTAEEKWMFQPKRFDSIYHITTSFVQQNLITDQLKAGIQCIMKVNLDAYRSQEHVMLEIPIPAGVRILNKTQQGGTTEFYKNKIVIFYNSLPMGQQTLSFEMMPNITGSFVLPAAKCSLMYYPYIYGNNETRSVEVR